MLIRSSNEELQSINEELETAKEELQSTNEELATVNDELENRNAELRRANEDLGNLIRSVDIPIIIVDPDLRIVRYTPGMDKLINLINSDLGRSLRDIMPNIEIPHFIETITTVIDTAKSQGMTLQNREGHWYSMRVHPYRVEENKIGGAVISFVDIDKIKKSLEEANAGQKYAEAIIEAVRHPMLVLDESLRVISCNGAFHRVFQVTEKETVGNLLYRLGNGQWGVPQLRAKLEEVITQGAVFDDLVVTHEFPNIGHRSMRISGRQIPSGVAAEPLVLMQIEAEQDSRDVTKSFVQRR